MTHQKCTVLFLLFVSFSAVFVSITGTAHAQSPQTIIPTIALASHPCPLHEFDPDCLVGVTTSVTFKIRFDSAIDADTFTGDDIEPSRSDVGGTLIEFRNQFTYHIYVNTDSTITLRIPAGVVFDTSGNTNSEAQITVRIDHEPPIMTIPEEYLNAYGDYTQGVRINRPYVEPNITCVDKVYEGVTDDGDKIFDRNDYYDAVPNINVTTAFEPEDLPKLFYVRYNCTDAGHRTYSEHLSVMLVKDLSAFNTPPALLKIERSSPHSENTDSQTLTYNVFFSKNVVGIDESDFVLSPHSTGVGNNATHPVTDVSPVTDRAYSVTISAATDGTYNLDLISSGHGITDIMRKPLTGTSPTTGTDHTYTVNTAVTDTINPRLASIERYSPASQNTDSQTLVYKATFSESVTGVNTSDFVLSPDSTGGEDTSSTGQFTQTRSPNLAIPYDDTVSDTITVSDSGTATSVTVAVDITHAYIGDLKIDLIAPDGTTNTLHNRSGVGDDDIFKTYYQSFGSIPISGVWTLRINDNHYADSGVLNSWTLTINYDTTTTTVNPVTAISGSGDTYYVTVSSTVDGTYNLDLVSSGHNIADTAGNSMTNTAPTGADQTYIVSITVTDTANPRLASIERYSPASRNTDSQSLVYKATFSESVTGVNTSDFVLSPGSTGGINSVTPVTAISGSGDTYYVTVSSTVDGTYNLDLVSSGHNIADTAGNSMTNTAPTGADQTYIVSITVTDTANPRLASIERYSPASRNTDSQSLVYKATFSESVTGVNTSDFVLSPGSTGGINSVTPVTAISGSGDTYYVTVSSTVDGTYNLDLVSSGHNIADASSNPLTNTAPTGADQTYIVSITVTDTANPRLASIERYSPASRNTDSQSLVYKATFSESVTGVNTSDFVLSPGSTGGINSVTPVTAISGSGDTYYVTVSSTVDGTYNLDLVSSGHNIADASSNPLTNTAPTGADQTYIVSITVTDTANPRLASIERYSPASRNTDSQSLVYKATFSESVTGVNTSDFVLSPGSTGGINSVTPVTAISGSGDTYYVTVSSTVDGTYNLDLVSSGHNIADASSNPLTNTAPTGADQTYIVSITVTDTANPRLASIERYSPASQNTDSQSLVYKATFSESVTGVNTSDFVLSPGSTGGINSVTPVTAISGSGDTYYVTVSSTVDGTYNLDLVSSGHNIADASSNPLTNTAPTGADQTYIVSITVTDTANPRLASIERYSPASQNTDSQSLVYKATFSESVTGVTASDFVLSPSSTGGVNGVNPVTAISGSGDTYYVTVSSTVDGTYNLDLVSSGHNIADASSNPLTNTAPTGADQTYIVSITVTDTANPRLASIERYSPASQNTDSQSLVYKATFSESVTGVNTSDFVLSPGSTGGINSVTPVTAISGSGDTYYVTVSSTVDGTYNLDLVSSGHNIADASSNPLTNTAPTGADQTYIVSITVTDTANPRLASIERYSPASQNTDSQSLVYKATFSESVTGVTASDFVLSPSSTGGVNGVNPVTAISGSGDTYYVTVSSTVDGTYNLDLVSSGHNIADASSNPLTNTAPTGADQTYIVSITVTDTANPRLASIERYSPASQNTDSQSLVYKATFSESVTGVTASDFVLSPDSTGGEGTTSTSTGQFTQARSPNLAIPYDATVSDTITVSDSETATSVSVAIDITHTYIGDLKIDLIAPDGTTKTLHNYSDGGEDDIDQTYAPSFGSIPISGVWILQIHDNYYADSGVLNSWTLTINYNTTTTTTTVNPVTAISGSGDTYYVTVSSTVDGTYNLDLVSSGHNIADASSNPLTNTAPTGADQTYIVSITVTDTANPRLASIERYSPASQNTDSQSLVYKATFSESVTGVTASDFVLSPSSTGGVNGVNPVTAISGSGDTYYVTVSSTVDGTYNLDLVSSGHNIADASSNPLTNTAPTGADQTYIVSITVTDTANPRLASIERYSPASQNTDSQSLVYKATFSESVTGVTASDFVLSPSSTGGVNGVNPVTAISGSGDTYYVTVSSTVDGTYNLDLVSSGHNIADASSNPLTNTAPTGADQTYIVSITVTDTANPRLASIERYSPASQNTDSQSLVYKATFSESVTGVTASDFVLSPDSTGGEGTTSTSTGQFTQARSPNLAIPYDATVSDTITVSDSETATSVSVAIDITHTYIGDLKIDLIAPDGTTKTLHNYSDGGEDDIDQTYAPSFGSIPISGVWILQIHDNYYADSGVLNSWTLTINYNTTTTTTTVNPVTAISGSGDTYYVTVSSTVDGTYNLDLVSSGHNIADASSNPLTNTAPTGADQTYTVSITVTDTANPRLASIERYSPASRNTDSQSLVYKATFSESVTGVTASDFVLSPSSTGGVNGVNPVTAISGSGDTYYVTVSSTVDGTYNLDLVSSGHNIADASSNPLTNTAPTGADQTYIVSITVTDTANPRLASIERYSPASQNTDSQSLVYKATFSESVTGVTASDFVLSPDSTGGEGTTSTSTGQFTQARSPNLAIPYDATVSDTITVSDSETATSVSVAIDITHTYIGDLKIDLIAPDGTTKTLHNYSDGGEDDIDQTYAPSFGSIPISGVWILQIHDNYYADSGVLNSWTLTINYNTTTTTTTVNPVTAISGSGDTYYVTVSSTVDGTYNLDLVSSGHNIADASSNPLTNTAPTGADQTYIVSITVTDTANPRLASIERYSPASQNTDSQSLVYKATFSESVTGVTASDFVLSPSSTGGVNGVNPVTAISGSGDTYYVTVSSTVDGTYNLDLVSSGHNIADASSNPLTNTAPTGADQTYIVSITVTDTANPRLASIERYSPASQNTDSQSLVYKATFSESVTGVTASDFVLSPSSTGGVNGVNPVTAISGSGDTYYVTVSSTVDGTYNLDLVSSGHNIADASSNPLTNTAPTGADQTYIVSITVTDTANPRLASIERYSPASQNTDSQSLVYKATFSESVTGVTASDFVLSPDSTGGEGTTSTSTGQFTQARSPNLAIPYDATVSDTITVSDSETATSVSVAIDITHTYIGDLKIDLIAPDGTTKTLHNYSDGGEDDIDQTYAPSFGSIPISGVWILQIHDNYYADSGVLNSWTLTINYNTTTTTTTVNPVTAISGSGDTYYVTVSSTVDGTYNLDLVSSGHNIADASSNPLTNTAPTGADQTYIVSITVTDTANPRLASIERYSPASRNTDSQSLVYKATFSESVTGVTASDFVLSPSSTGGVNGVNPVTAISGSGDTYYVTVSSTVDGTYNLDLVSSGHNIADASSNPLTNTAPTGADQTYIVSITVTDTANPRLASIERYSPASQNTDSQSLVYKATFSESVTGVTASDFVLSPSSTGGGNSGNSQVTAISSSGSVYYVTVSAAQDGTYNLDLVLSGHGIEDTADNPLINTVPATGTDETYTVSTTVTNITAPTLLSIERYNQLSATTSSRTLIYEVTFSENVTGVYKAVFVLSPGSTGGTGNDSDHIVYVSGSGSVYNVIVVALADGTYNLDLVSSGHSIVDTDNNPLTYTAPTTGIDETYIYSTAN